MNLTHHLGQGSQFQCQSQPRIMPRKADATDVSPRFLTIYQDRGKAALVRIAFGVLSDAAYKPETLREVKTTAAHGEVWRKAREIVRQRIEAVRAVMVERIRSDSEYLPALVGIVEQEGASGSVYARDGACELVFGMGDGDVGQLLVHRYAAMKAELTAMMQESGFEPCVVSNHTVLWRGNRFLFPPGQFEPEFAYAEERQKARCERKLEELVRCLRVGRGCRGLDMHWNGRDVCSDGVVVSEREFAAAGIGKEHGQEVVRHRDEYLGSLVESSTLPVIGSGSSVIERVWCEATGSVHEGSHTLVKGSVLEALTAARYARAAEQIVSTRI